MTGIAAAGLAIAARRSYPGPGQPPPGEFIAARDLSRFSLPAGFKIELVASDPMVASPVAMSFDEDGRLWVVEMDTFMPDVEGRGELSPINRIVILEDEDGDGAMDRSSVFLDGLVLPRAVMPCYGGALVLEPPNLYFCPDLNRDGRADSKVLVLSGFGGLENPEHAGNGMVYGLDNWIYLSQHPLRLRFDGTSMGTEKTPANGQWGIAQDNTGRVYYTPNSESLRVDAVPHHYGARNPNQTGMAGVYVSVCREQTVWPAHPTSVNRGYQPGTLREDGTLKSHTAACGPVIYGSTVLGPDFTGNAFVCEPAGNLVKRLTLREEGGVPRGVAAYPDREFLTSTDERFRPVNMAVGPEGALYIADMHRGLLQHKNFVTDYLRGETRRKRLERPIGLGRIYRVAPTTGAAVVARPALSRASTETLVDALQHADRWWRQTAQRLIVERRAKEALPRLRELAQAHDSIPTRLHALWTLDGLGEATREDAVLAMRDPAAAVRAAGLRVGEAHVGHGDVRSEMRRLLNDPDRMVRVQAVLSIGTMSGREELYIEVLQRHGEDPFIRSAIVSGLCDREGVFLSRLMESKQWPASQSQRDMVNLLSECILRSEDGEQRRWFVEALASLALVGDSRASLLMAALGRAQGVDSQSPRSLSLAGEPLGWSRLIAAAENPINGTARESDWYLTWPGRPRRDPPRKLRPLTDGEMGRYGRGQFLYTDCVACHGEDGKGLAGLGPPLAGSARVQGPVTRLIRILLHGFEGEIQRDGVV
jgi:HEAT repeat protein